MPLPTHRRADLALGLGRADEEIACRTSSAAVFLGCSAQLVSAIIAIIGAVRTAARPLFGFIDGEWAAIAVLHDDDKAVHRVT